MNPGGDMRVVSDLLETNAAREAVLKEAEMSDAKELVYKVMDDVKRRDPDQTEFHQAVWEVLESLVPVRSQMSIALTPLDITDPLPPPSTPPTPPPPPLPPPRRRRSITAPLPHLLTAPTPSHHPSDPIRFSRRTLNMPTTAFSSDSLSPSASFRSACRGPTTAALCT